MTTTTAYAICTTGGGEHEPRPVLRLLYPSDVEAIRVREHLRLERDSYPIRKVEIRVIEEEA